MWHRLYIPEDSQDKASSVRQESSEGSQCQEGMKSLTDSIDNLVVGYRAGRVYHNTADQLIVYVSVKMF